MRALLTLTLLAACSGSDDGETKPTDTPSTTDTPTDTLVDTADSATTPTTDTGTTESTETLCLNRVLGRFPADGSTDAFFGTSVEFNLNLVDPTAAITVSGPSGDVPGSSEVLGKRIRWTADDALLPDTAYTGTLTWACDPETTTFTTSGTGNEVDVADLEGKAYRLDLANGRWIQPSGLGPVIGALLAADILIGVHSPGPDQLELTFARTLDFGLPQDRCEPTTLFPVADFARNPLYAVGPADVDLEIGGAAMPVNSLELTGAFTADGQAMEGGRLAGLADVGALSGVLLGSSDPTAVCALLAPFSVTCLPCPNGGIVSCVQIEVDSIHGPVDPAGVETRTVSAIRKDPSCN